MTIREELHRVRILRAMTDDVLRAHIAWLREDGRGRGKAAEEARLEHASAVEEMRRRQHGAAPKPGEEG